MAPRAERQPRPRRSAPETAPAVPTPAPVETPAPIAPRVPERKVAHEFDIENVSGRVRFYESGEVTIFLKPNNPVDLPLIPTPPDVLAPRGDEPKPPEAPRAANSAQEKEPLVDLTGRVGRDPLRSPDGEPNKWGKFPLATHEGDRTDWHQIFTSGDRVKMMDKVAKGQTVTVRGYDRGLREVPGRDGGTRQEHTVFAVAIKTPKPPAQPQQ